MANTETLQPSLILVIRGREISGYVQDQVLSFVFTNHLEGESDTLELELEDAAGIWQGDWYPTHGDTMTASIGYSKGYLAGNWLPCGDFQIDETELSTPADVFTIRALAAGTEHQLRTPAAKAYDATTLADIAAQVAERNGLELTGEIADIAVKRVTQAQERDLPFLRRLADEYGHAFTVRGNLLCMYKRADLKAEAAALTLRREDVATARFKDKISAEVASTNVSYHDPALKEMHTGEVEDQEGKLRRHSRDARRINIRAESPEQAQLKAEAALERANEDQTTCSITTMGDVRLAAGVNIDLVGWGAFNGKYQITTSRHSFGRGQGYATDVEARRVRT